jgi:hypothetical protein
VVLFAVRGVARGTVSQFFALLGLLAGFWCAGWVAQWVGARWQGARPAFLFSCLRWLVAGLSGLAVATLLQWWGNALGGAVKKSPFGVFDRIGGLAVGAGLGVLVGSLTMLGALLTTWPAALGEAAARSRFATPLMTVGAKLCGVEHRYFPGSDWLEEKFLAARRRAQSQSPQS